MIYFNIFSKSKAEELLSSRLFSDKTFYRQFKNDLKRARQDVIIESPFLAVNRTDSFLPLFKKLKRRGVRVRVNTRNPRHHSRELQIQAWQSIKALRVAGVKVKFYSDMRHRKLAVIDKHILWEGSLNILSQSHSKEIMRRTNSKDMAVQMVRFTRMDTWIS